jgi:hypothetical protein
MASGTSLCSAGQALRGDLVLLGRAQRCCDLTASILHHQIACPAETRTQDRYKLVKHTCTPPAQRSAPEWAGMPCAASDAAASRPGPATPGAARMFWTPAVRVGERRDSAARNRGLNGGQATQRIAVAEGGFATELWMSTSAQGRQQCTGDGKRMQELVGKHCHGSMSSAAWPDC